ncbi:1-deoxy-D-xylulose-5-phosphate synthase [Lactococcus formosensis]|uniref:1-deoxy-D-xylulose-5-phosphate synthase n=1 Tax=Lactococcus formosensis TaxID=1281486 RepID=UPI0002E40492|nr:1-deoxy-D-xylulose-5-phosphate synthase [Lactococcus formosensis]MDG6112792.1 1-deoxy-D-xylulose-5-phosphate synthase [Lactococcus formosensis]MDG6115198.1 1-deoxy-D-xylulose-5-phosphate synthase [Lactococcus formosensis]MDG6121349.1 1-deoxy-D-xylulose-5-phosphate synthase [Lactococcus formosensis]MDG6124266.1 1-deoxy-D-xylulose-5-phosphate synthase [Lactococcus formosensis]MDG6127513.1 1-deoxy-D-xylulose-5-phosphate synthase [Lactococcus formosensis]
MTILDKVNAPADLKKLSAAELTELAQDVRGAVLNKVSQIGGHTGPNLGVVELTIALHKVFQSPVDKFIWDVSHQTYPHKILTGRKHGFQDGHFHDITGYTSQHESEHDFFTVGHTSTSVANAMGLAKARDLTGQDGNIIAILGDGSLSGGLALEAISNAGAYNKNFILILNDNQMSIAENHGGIYKGLAELRATEGQSPNNLFKAFGLDYKYLADGNNLEALISLFEEVKDIKHPIVLHINTEKGHGYKPAVDMKEAFHWRSPFNLADGSLKNVNSTKNYTRIILDYMEEKVSEGTPLVAVNGGIPMVNNLKEFAEKYPENYVDAGIAEQYVTTFGGAVAAGGARAMIFHNSTFMQRAYDQFLHDLAINKEPAVVIVKSASISGSDKTHQGSFAIGMLSNIPDLIYLAPTSEEELVAMLDWALTQKDNPVVLQIPEHGVENRSTVLTDFSKAQYEIAHKGEEVAILALGGLFSHGQKVVTELEKLNIKATLVNPMFVAELDKATLKELTEDHNVFVTIEDGVLDGGFGQKVAGYLGQFGVKILNYGADKEFNDSVAVDELYDRYHLTPELMIADILEALK